MQPPVFPNNISAYEGSAAESFSLTIPSGVAVVTASHAP